MSNLKSVAFLFPGQGAQYPGMAKDFYQNFPAARQIFEEADDILRRNLTKIVLEGDEKELTETRNSQTGIFVASIAILRVFQELYSQWEPSFCSGLSLGEYTALTAAGVLDFQAGLELVNHRSEFMNDACESNPGAMAVILGLAAEEVEELVQDINMPHDLWAANFNCPGQVVISGTMRGIEAGTAAAKQKGAKRVLPLQVHGAFHSGLMQEAKERLAPFIDAAPLREPASQIVMNVPGDIVHNMKDIRKYMIDQVTSPVRWEQGIRRLMREGVELYVEIGCGKTLSGFNKKMQTSRTISIEKIADLDLFNPILA